MAKTKNKLTSCFAPHTMMHSLFGLGLGILLVSLVPSLGVWWVGIVLMVAATVWDSMRK